MSTARLIIQNENYVLEKGARMIYAFRRLNKARTGYYYGLEWRSSDGERCIITFDKSTVITVLPYGLSHRDLTEEGIQIGTIHENRN